MLSPRPFCLRLVSSPGRAPHLSSIRVAVSSPTRLPCHARNMERDSSPVLRGPTGESRAVAQDHITLALSHFPVGRGAMVADERLGIGLRQPAVLLAALETTQHQTS